MAELDWLDCQLIPVCPIQYAPDHWKFYGKKQICAKRQVIIFVCFLLKMRTNQPTAFHSEQAWATKTI